MKVINGFRCVLRNQHGFPFKLFNLISNVLIIIIKVLMITCYKQK